MLQFRDRHALEMCAYRWMAGQPGWNVGRTSSPRSPPSGSCLSVLQVISHQTHLNNLLLNSTLLTQRPSSPPGGSNIVYLPPTTSGKRTRTGANTSLATPARKETKRKVANPDGGGRGGKRDRETTELLDEWYDSSSHKQSPGKGAPSGSARARVDGPSKKKRSVHTFVYLQSDDGTTLSGYWGTRSERKRSASEGYMLPTVATCMLTSLFHLLPSSALRPIFLVLLANYTPFEISTLSFHSHQARPASPALSSTSFDPHNPASTSHASPRFDPARPSRFKDDPILPPSSSSAFQQSVAVGSNTHGPMDPSQASLGPGFDGASSYGDDKQRARARTNTGGAASPMPDDESRTGGAGRPVRRPANSTATHDERGRQFETESEDESEDDEDASRGPGGGPEGGVGAGVGGAGGAGDGEGGDQAKYCYCKGASYGEMIGCDDDDCLIEWVSAVPFVPFFLLSAAPIMATRD